jgi:hypothetical protein
MKSCRDPRFFIRTLSHRFDLEQLQSIKQTEGSRPHSATRHRPSDTDRD